MIGSLLAHVRKQPIIALYFEFDNKLEFYNLGASSLFPSEMIEKPEKTQSTAKQNKDLTQKPTSNEREARKNNEWKQEQTMNKQQ